MSRIMTSQNQIEAILDEQVRPVLRSHGGDIRIQHYVDGVLTVKLLG